MSKHEDKVSYFTSRMKTLGDNFCDKIRGKGVSRLKPRGGRLRQDVLLIRNSKSSKVCRPLGDNFCNFQLQKLHQGGQTYTAHRALLQLSVAKVIGEQYNLDPLSQLSYVLAVANT